MEAKVFVSHSSKDRNVVEDICDFLESNEVKCWVSYRISDLRPGTAYPVEIGKAIKKCKVFLVVISKNSFQSEQVLNELTMANGRVKHGARIMSIIIDDELEADNLEDGFDYLLAGVQAVYWNQIDQRVVLLEEVKRILDDSGDGVELSTEYGDVLERLILDKSENSTQKNSNSSNMIDFVPVSTCINCDEWRNVLDMDAIVVFNLVEYYDVEEKVSYPIVVVLDNRGEVKIIDAVGWRVVFRINLGLEEKEIFDITGITYIKDMLVMSHHKSNVLTTITINSNNREFHLEKKMKLDVSNVKVIKNVLHSNEKGRVILQVEIKDSIHFKIWDVGTDEFEEIPFNNHVIDVAANMLEPSEEVYVAYGENAEYGDDDFMEVEYEILKRYKKTDRDDVIMDSCLTIQEGILDTFYERPYSRGKAKGTMKWPLEKYSEYKTYWPNLGVGCISSTGKNIVLFYEEMKNPVVLIANTTTGDVSYLFDMPEKIRGSVEKYRTYFDDMRSVLFLISDDGMECIRYFLRQNREEIDRLNRVYNQYVNDNKNPTYQEEFRQFERIYCRVLDSVEITPF